MASELEIMRIKADLKRRAAQKFPGDKERQDAYIWGTIRKIKGER